jgi:hypothetical protein
MFEKIKKLFESDSEPSTSEAQPSKSELNEFTDLTSRLIDLMGEFALLTLRTISNRKGAPLNRTQIEETVDFDLQFRIQQIQDPELLDIVRKRVISEYIEEQKNTSQN